MIRVLLTIAGCVWGQTPVEEASTELDLVANELDSLAHGRHVAWLDANDDYMRTMAGDPKMDQATMQKYVAWSKENSNLLSSLRLGLRGCLTSGGLDEGRVRAGLDFTQQMANGLDTIALTNAASAFADVDASAWPFPRDELRRRLRRISIRCGVALAKLGRPVGEPLFVVPSPEVLTAARADLKWIVQEFHMFFQTRAETWGFLRPRVVSGLPKSAFVREVDDGLSALRRVYEPMKMFWGMGLSRIGPNAYVLQGLELAVTLAKRISMSFDAFSRSFADSQTETKGALSIYGLLGEYEKDLARVIEKAQLTISKLEGPSSQLPKAEAPPTVVEPASTKPIPTDASPADVGSASTEPGPADVPPAVVESASMERRAHGKSLRSKRKEYSKIAHVQALHKGEEVDDPGQGPESVSIFHPEEHERVCADQSLECGRELNRVSVKNPPKVMFAEAVPSDERVTSETGREVELNPEAPEFIPNEESADWTAAEAMPWEQPALFDTSVLGDTAVIAIDQLCRTSHQLAAELNRMTGLCDITAAGVPITNRVLLDQMGSLRDRINQLLSESVQVNFRSHTAMNMIYPPSGGMIVPPFPPNIL